jgi:mannonate dehydratase
MKRRDFFAAAAGAAGLGLGCTRQEPAPRVNASVSPTPVPFVLGCQSGPTSDERLDFFKRHGVDHICGWPDDYRSLKHYTVEDVSKLRERCEKHGIRLEMVGAPFLTSSHIDREERGAVMLGQDPERDRDIEDIQKSIVACAEAGVPAMKYNMSILGVLRTESAHGRGGIRLSTWKLSEAKPETPKTRAGDVSADIFWERITYFLERVVPVANEYKIRLACHPHDPGVPPEGYQGVDRVLGTVDGLKKLVSIQESPYHGLNFCQGSVSEMLQNPAKEIYEVIRYFGSRKKIFLVHFRNIRGRRDDFVETFPDNGDIDMIKAAMVYKEVGYPYMLTPDHVPTHPDDPHRNQAFAFSYGYIHGVIQALEHMG